MRRFSEHSNASVIRWLKRRLLEANDDCLPFGFSNQWNHSLINVTRFGSSQLLIDTYVARLLCDCLGGHQYFTPQPKTFRQRSLSLDKRLQLEWRSQQQTDASFENGIVNNDNQGWGGERFEGRDAIGIAYAMADIERLLETRCGKKILWSEQLNLKFNHDSLRGEISKVLNVINSWVVWKGFRARWECLPIGNSISGWLLPRSDVLRLRNGFELILKNWKSLTNDAINSPPNSFAFHALKRASESILFRN